MLILVLPTFLNHFTENTFKQFYTKIYPSKPEIGKMFLHMDKMNIFNYSFVINNDNQPLSLFYMGAPYKNYLEKYSIKISQNFKYINYIFSLHDIEYNLNDCIVSTRTGDFTSR